MLYNFLNKKDDVVFYGFTSASEYEAFTNDGKNTDNLNKALTISAVRHSPYVDNKDFYSSCSSPYGIVRDNGNIRHVVSRNIVFDFNIISVEGNFYNTNVQLSNYISFLTNDAVKILCYEKSYGVDNKGVFLYVDYVSHNITWVRGAHNLVGILSVVYVDRANGWREAIIDTPVPTDDNLKRTISRTYSTSQYKDEYQLSWDNSFEVSDVFSNYYKSIIFEKLSLDLVKPSNNSFEDWIFFDFLGDRGTAYIDIAASGISQDVINQASHGVLSIYFMDMSFTKVPMTPRVSIKFLPNDIDIDITKYCYGLHNFCMLDYKLRDDSFDVGFNFRVITKNAYTNLKVTFDNVTGIVEI